MVNQPAWGTDRIKLLAYEIQNRRTKRGRELSEEEVEEKKQEKRDLEARREKAKEGAKAKRKLETKITAEADRGIAHTTKESDRIIATLGEKLDRLGASSSRDDLLQRLLGQPGSSKEIQAEIDARKEDLKRKRREEREEEKQAEKRRKLEQLFEIPLEEGDTLQDGVVLRGDLGRRKMRGLQAVGDFRFGRLRCCLVEIGETAMLQLDPLNDQQLTVLESMTGSNNSPGTIVKLLAVTKDGTVEAQFLKEKLCGPNRRPIRSPCASPKPAEEPVQPVEPAQPEPVETASVEPPPVEPVEPDVEMSEKPVEEPDAEMTEKPADEDLELWEMALGGSTLRFSVDRVTSISPLGRERLITPVKEDLAAFKACRHQGLRDLLHGQFLLSPRLWNESVTKASSRTVSASEAPAEEAPAEPVEPEPVEPEPVKPEEMARVRAEREAEREAERKREVQERLDAQRAQGLQRIQGFLARPLKDGWIELSLENYEDARFRVESGFVFGTVTKCRIIRGDDVREVKELPDTNRLGGAKVHVHLPALAEEAPAVEASEGAAEEAPEAAPEAPAQEAPEAAPEAPAEEASDPEAPAEEAPEEAPTYPSDEVERGGLAGFEMDGEGNFQLKAYAGVSRGSAHPPGKDGRWQRGQVQADDRRDQGERKVVPGEPALPNHAQRQAHAAEGQEIRGA